LLGAGVLGVAIDLLLAWDCQVIITQSYQSILAIAVGLMLLLLNLGKPPLGIAVAALSVAYTLAVWVYEPLRELPRVDPLAVGVYVLIVFAGIVAIARMDPARSRA
jgi:hypothetical protein